MIIKNPYLGVQATKLVKTPPSTPSSSQPPRSADPMFSEGVAAGATSFGEILRDRRQHRDLTLAEVGIRVGCQTSYLSMVERGKRPPPTLPVLRQLEATLGFNIGDLVEAAHWQAAPAIVRQRFLERMNESQPS